MLTEYDDIPITRFPGFEDKNNQELFDAFIVTARLRDWRIKYGHSYPDEPIFHFIDLKKVGIGDIEFLVILDEGKYTSVELRRMHYNKKTIKEVYDNESDFPLAVEMLMSWI